jgi:hypothetical protein
VKHTTNLSNIIIGSSKSKNKKSKMISTHLKKKQRMVLMRFLSCGYILQAGAHNAITTVLSAQGYRRDIPSPALVCSMGSSIPLPT